MGGVGRSVCGCRLFGSGTNRFQKVIFYGMYPLDLHDIWMPCMYNLDFDIGFASGWFFPKTPIGGARVWLPTMHSRIRRPAETQPCGNNTIIVSDQV